MRDNFTPSRWGEPGGFLPGQSMRSSGARLIQEWRTMRHDVLISQPSAATTLLLSMEETARTLGVSRNAVYRLISSGGLRTLTVGRRRLVPLRECESFISRQLGEEDPLPKEVVIGRR